MIIRRKIFYTYRCLDYHSNWSVTVAHKPHELKDKVRLLLLLLSNALIMSDSTYQCLDE